MAYTYRYPNVERCVNCGWNMIRSKKNKHAVSREFNIRVGELPELERELLASWVPPQKDLEKRPVCKDCHGILSSVSDAPRPMERQVGHPEICACCGDSVLRSGRKSQRIAMLKDNSRPEYEILHPYSQLFKGEGLVCRVCMTSARRKVEKASMELVKANTSSVYLMEPEDNILQPLEPEPEDLETEKTTEHDKTLPKASTSKEPPCSTQKHETARPETKCFQNPVKSAEFNPKHQLQTLMKLEYKKVFGKKGTCVACDEATVRRVNLPTRQLLLLRHKLYVTTYARVCERHHNFANWPSNDLVTSNEFHEEEIADMVFLLKRFRPIDLGNVESVDSMILEQWLGVSLEEYQRLLELHPVLSQDPDGKFGLAVWLARTYTGECATVLASLTQRTKAQVSSCLKIAHDCFSSNTTDEPTKQVCDEIGTNQ